MLRWLSILLQQDLGDLLVVSRGSGQERPSARYSTHPDARDAATSLTRDKNLSRAWTMTGQRQSPAESTRVFASRPSCVFPFRSTEIEDLGKRGKRSTDLQRFRMHGVNVLR